MRLLSLFEEAWLAIRTNRSRTALTILGIVIGVGSVISVVGVGDGAKQVVGDLLGQFGSTSLIVAPNFTAIRESKGKLRFEEITREDIETINAARPAVRGGHAADPDGCGGEVRGHDREGDPVRHHAPVPLREQARRAQGQVPRPG